MGAALRRHDDQENAHHRLPPSLVSKQRKRRANGLRGSRASPFFGSRVLSHKYSRFAHVVEEEFMRQCNSGIPSVLSCFAPKSDLELSSTRGCQL
jgi:hypothetical protein